MHTYYRPWHNNTNRFGSNLDRSLFAVRPATRSSCIIQASSQFTQFLENQADPTKLLDHLVCILDNSQLYSVSMECLARFFGENGKKVYQERFKQGLRAVTKSQNKALHAELYNQLLPVATSESFETLKHKLESLPDWSRELTELLEFDQQWLIKFFAPRAFGSQSHAHKALTEAWAQAANNVSDEFFKQNLSS